jgi:2-polyprenyl-3-methyl-5-hydroxy-6-metoxy-1,4-benzoquinol methylase
MSQKIPKADYNEFYDSRLVAIYDTFNSLGADSEFFCQEAQKLNVSTIIDMGCGTGLLTCELAKQ